MTGRFGCDLEVLLHTMVMGQFGFRRTVCPASVDNLYVPKTTHPVGAKAFVAGMGAAAMVCVAFALTHWHSSDPVKFACYLAVALLASSLKIKLPGINGTMSVNFLFILLGVLELSFAQTLM